MRNPSLRQLEALLAVIETGTVSAAADVLRISQPAASKLIRNLEADTGLDLFERDSGRLVPTGRGMRLYEEVERIFGGANQLARVVEAIRREEHGQILVGVIPGLSGPFMRRVLTRFRQANPDVFVVVESRSSQYLADAVLLRRLDVALIAMPVEHSSVENAPLTIGPTVCVMPKDHRLAALDTVSAADIGDAPFISFGSTSQTRRRIDAAFDAAGQRLNVVIEASIAQNVAEFVAAGFGVTVAQAVFFESLLDRVEMRPFVPVVAEDLTILRPIRARNGKLVDAFAAAVRYAAQERIPQA